MPSERRSAKKRTADATTARPAAKRTRRNADPVETRTHPTSQWTIPQEMMNSIVQQVTKAVTEQLTQLPTQQPTTNSTQLREVPLVPTSQAATIPQADNLVTNAVATAQSVLSSINSPQRDIPLTLFTSTSLSVD